jgi:cytochrome oxidase Cu insertion factor (SCO1/SenC/PrrC family)
MTTIKGEPMKTRFVFLNLLILLAFVLAACGGAAAPDAMMDKPTEEAMMDKGTATPDAMMPHDAPTVDAMAKPTEGATMESPAWFSARFTDSRSGQVFTINDFKGKVVLVETMAVWCSNCRRQQEQILSLHELLGERDDFVSLSLDIDPNEDAAYLTAYVQSVPFDWLYAIAPAEVSREIAQIYGDQFLNPPSTPILVVDRHGAAHPLPFGIKSAEDLMQAVQPYLDESM